MPQPLYNTFWVQSRNRQTAMQYPNKNVQIYKKWPFYGHFLYNLYIFGIHLQSMLYPKLCYNKQCFKEVCVYSEINQADFVFGFYVTSRLFHSYFLYQTGRWTGVPRCKAPNPLKAANHGLHQVAWAKLKPAVRRDLVIKGQLHYTSSLTIWPKAVNLRTLNGPEMWTENFDFLEKCSESLSNPWNAKKQKGSNSPLTAKSYEISILGSLCQKVI